MTVHGAPCYDQGMSTKRTSKATAAASAARSRRRQERMAAELRAAGWRTDEPPASAPGWTEYEPGILAGLAAPKPGWPVCGYVRGNWGCTLPANHEGPRHEFSRNGWVRVAWL